MLLVELNRSFCHSEHSFRVQVVSEGLPDEDSLGRVVSVVISVDNVLTRADGVEMAGGGWGRV